MIISPAQGTTKNSQIKGKIAYFISALLTEVRAYLEEAIAPAIPSFIR
jgi:hypothetical protein